MPAGGKREDAPILKQICGLADLTGWTYQHSRPARTKDGWRTPITGRAGFPDLVMAHPRHGVLFWEIKGPTGYPSDDQVHWIGILPYAQLVRDCEHDWQVAKAILTGKAGPETPMSLMAHRGIWLGSRADWATKKFGPPRTALTHQNKIS